MFSTPTIAASLAATVGSRRRFLAALLAEPVAPVDARERQAAE